jgi:acyl-coenzyme A synthetase/AMP-(fatty) acid ligase
MTGYLDDPAATAARFDGEWLRTGDLVRLEPDGRCHLIGRSDGFIKTASTDRVAPEEVEAVLAEHEAIADAAVLGASGSDGFERIAALVVLRAPPADPQLPQHIAAFVKDRLGAARTPSRLRFVERIPRLENGKIMRSQLPELLDG